ncbi:MAG: pyridoxamine 5'-phosphate oxidase family protein [Bacteroidales bacterium]|jgi:uncharacterized pyridoxamine 5'-phosphate oxidase family protein|nr:pyridoxamine 5'-phosphate oxidase family protein [Bacteroidales bacterium]
MDKILEFLDDCGVYYLATSDGHQAKVRPMNFARDVNGKLSFYTSKLKDLYRQLEKNPLAEISATGKRGWIRIYGSISFHDSPEIFEKWAEKAEYFRFTDENRVVCSFESATVEYMPGYQAPLPDFAANWEKTLMPEGEIKCTEKL